MIIIERRWDIDNPRGGLKLIPCVARKVFKNDDIEEVQKFLDEQFEKHDGIVWYNTEYKYIKI